MPRGPGVSQYFSWLLMCGNNLIFANILAKFVNQHNIHARSFDKNRPPGVWLMGMQHRNIQFYIFFPGRFQPTWDILSTFASLTAKTSFCYKDSNMNEQANACVCPVEKVHQSEGMLWC